MAKKKLIKASAIHFDDFGRIIVDPATQSELGSFKLPPWLGGPGGGGTGSGTDVACPSPDAACVPESVCANTDVACVPEGACADTDVACVPESVCSDPDVACVPESICSDPDVACVPESICTDVACVPEGACADGKCIDVFCGEKNKECPTNMECGLDPGEPIDIGSTDI